MSIFMYYAKSLTNKKSLNPQLVIGLKKPDWTIVEPLTNKQSILKVFFWLLLFFFNLWKWLKKEIARKL